MSGDVLVVRHGPGRGRDPGMLPHLVDEIGRDHPELAGRLPVHHTGTPAPSLDGLAAVWFCLADPLREHFPDCYREAKQLADRARSLGVRIINDPDALSNTIKSVQAMRWRAAGIATPEHHRFADATDLDAVLERAAFPAILRADELHAQSGMRVCASAAGVRALPPADVSFPGAMAEFVDVRAAYPRSAGVWSELFHKKRQFVFGSRTRTSHLFFSSEPLVSSSTYLFRSVPDAVGWRDRLRHPRYARRQLTAARQLRAAIEEDLRYWEAGREAPDLMRRAVAALGLDVAAVDYSTLGDGSHVLWEANPYFYISPPHERRLSDERRTPDRVVSYRDSIAEFLLAVSSREPASPPMPG